MCGNGDEWSWSKQHRRLQKSSRPALARYGKRPHINAMANIIAFLFGLIALVLAIIGFIPLLGWLNWLIILIAGVGAVFGFASEKNSGRNFCFAVMAICALRLWMGGGII
jgi:hypothetical protein